MFLFLKTVYFYLWFLCKSDFRVNNTLLFCGYFSNSVLLDYKFLMTNFLQALPFLIFSYLSLTLLRKLVISKNFILFQCLRYNYFTFFCCIYKKILIDFTLGWFEKLINNGFRICDTVDLSRPGSPGESVLELPIDGATSSNLGTSRPPSSSRPLSISASTNTEATILTESTPFTKEHASTRTGQNRMRTVHDMNRDRNSTRKRGLSDLSQETGTKTRVQGNRKSQIFKATKKIYLPFFRLLYLKKCQILMIFAMFTLWFKTLNCK